MLETEQFNAMHSMHGIKTQLFVSANNTEYRSDDIYIKKAHGSLKLTLEATKKYEEPINFIRSIYDDIENENDGADRRIEFSTQVNGEHFCSINDGAAADGKTYSSP